MANIYSDPIDVRIKRLQETVWNRDYEGTTTVLTSDLIELLSHIKEKK